MFPQNSTGRVRRVVALANQCARGKNHDYLAPEHLLLGFLKENESFGIDILRSLGVDLQKLWNDVEGQLVAGPDEVTIPSLVQPNSTKLVFERGVKEAGDLRHQFFGAQHLLLGLIQDEGIAGQTLARFGVTLEATRAEIVRFLTTGRPRSRDLEIDLGADSCTDSVLPQTPQTPCMRPAEFDDFLRKASSEGLNGAAVEAQKIHMAGCPHCVKLAEAERVQNLAKSLGSSKTATPPSVNSQKFLAGEFDDGG